MTGKTSCILRSSAATVAVCERPVCGINGRWLTQYANMLNKRMEVRPQHLEGMTKLDKHIVCAGGLTDKEGKLKGSVVIVDFDDEADVKEYLSNEPYVVAGVWQDITCEPINVVLVNGEKYTPAKKAPNDENIP